MSLPPAVTVTANIAPAWLNKEKKKYHVLLFTTTAVAVLSLFYSVIPQEILILHYCKLAQPSRQQEVERPEADGTKQVRFFSTF